MSETPSKELRALRLWHWKQAMDARQDTRDAERYRPYAIRIFEATVGFHIKAVQTLNDFFPVGDTAEDDAAREARG